jgi:hypothetical protein
LRGLVNEPSGHQLAHGAGDDVVGLPATRAKVGHAAQQPPVVVTHELAGELQQQSLGRMAQA